MGTIKATAKKVPEPGKLEVFTFEVLFQNGIRKRFTDENENKAAAQAARWAVKNNAGKVIVLTVTKIK